MHKLWLTGQEEQCVGPLQSFGAASGFQKSQNGLQLINAGRSLGSPASSTEVHKDPAALTCPLNQSCVDRASCAKSLWKSTFSDVIYKAEE